MTREKDFRSTCPARGYQFENCEKEITNISNCLKKELKSIHEQPKHGYGQLYFQGTGDYFTLVTGTMRPGDLYSRTRNLLNYIGLHCVNRSL